MWASGKGNLATAQQEAAFPTFTALLAKALPSPSLPSGNEGREGNLMGEGGGGYLAFECQFRSTTAVAGKAPSLPSSLVAHTQRRQSWQRLSRRPRTTTMVASQDSRQR